MEKVKRKRVYWFDVYLQVHDSSMDQFFRDLMNRRINNKKHRMSLNRCAYYTLKKFYSTTAIVQLRERFGSL